MNRFCLTLMFLSAMWMMAWGIVSDKNLMLPVWGIVVTICVCGLIWEEDA